MKFLKELTCKKKILVIYNKDDFESCISAAIISHLPAEILRWIFLYNTDTEEILKDPEVQESLKRTMLVDSTSISIITKGYTNCTMLNKHLGKIKNYNAVILLGTRFYDKEIRRIKQLGNKKTYCLSGIAYQAKEDHRMNKINKAHNKKHRTGLSRLVLRYLGFQPRDWPFLKKIKNVSINQRFKSMNPNDIHWLELLNFGKG